MTIEQELRARSGEVCEICGENSATLVPYLLPDSPTDGTDAHVLLCSDYADQLTGATPVEPERWRVLADSVWSSVPAVQVLSYRMLHQLRGEGWPIELLDMVYLEDEVRRWAEAGLPDEQAIVHQDAHGNVLQAGDTVVLTKDLNVKGAGFTAKRGTAVRRIALVYDNPKHIEGRVNGQQIIILTEFVKKQNK